MSEATKIVLAVAIVTAIVATWVAAIVTLG